MVLIISKSIFSVLGVFLLDAPISQKLCPLLVLAEAAEGDSLVVDVLSVHPAIELGQFDRQDDARQQEEGAAAQTHPEGVLEFRQRARKGEETRVLAASALVSSKIRSFWGKIHSRFCLRFSWIKPNAKMFF